MCESTNASTDYFASWLDILHAKEKINAGPGKKRKYPNGWYTYYIMDIFYIKILRNAFLSFPLLSVFDNYYA